MTIIDAIKSGKPFRRPEWYGVSKVWLGREHELVEVHRGIVCRDYHPTVADLIAEDWETVDDAPREG